MQVCGKHIPFSNNVNIILLSYTMLYNYIMITWKISFDGESLVSVLLEKYLLGDNLLSRDFLE